MQHRKHDYMGLWMQHSNQNLSLYYTHPLLWGLILDWKIEDSWRLKACSLYNLSLSSKFKHKFDTTYTQSSVKYTNIIFNQIYTIYNNFKANIYMKYILYTRILQDIIFNDTFQILISQILYQYKKLHINATLGIKSIHNSISQILYPYINFTLMPLLA